MVNRFEGARLSTKLDGGALELRNDQSISKFCQNLAHRIEDAVDTPRSFEHLRADYRLLSDLVNQLVWSCHEQSVVFALMVLKWHYASEDADDLGLHSTRGFACEILAWRFLSHLHQNERMHQLLDEVAVPIADESTNNTVFGFDLGRDRNALPSDTEALLSSRSSHHHVEVESDSTTRASRDHLEDEDDLAIPFYGWNSLEIAAVSDAKKLISQKSVQDVVTDVWNGDIIFWDSLHVHTRKRPQYYNKVRDVSLYSRLRVPKYVKAFEAIFFASFLALYYAVLLERSPMRVTFTEILLYVWIAAFAYDEFGEYRAIAAGPRTRFYAADIWNITDFGILLIALAFVLMRIVGLVRQDPAILDTSMDIFSLEALLLVPRICALLSLHPFFGTLLPCLQKMSWDFVKFLGIVIILYLGFLTTFTMLGRDAFTPKQISWMLLQVFFGSSYIGFEIASDISKLLGPPIMIIFVCMTNILLVTSLISLLSNTLDKVMDHAREEYLFQYSVFVLEASASRRLTYYFPPFNLVPLILVRPLRLCLRGEQTRSLRIKLFKIHFPYIAAIWVYERLLLTYNGIWKGSRDSKGKPLGQQQEPLVTPRTPSKRARIASRHSMYANPLALTGKSESSLVRTPGLDHQGRTSAPGPGHTDMEELRQMIDGLSRQVHELASRMGPATASLDKSPPHQQFPRRTQDADPDARDEGSN